MKRLLLVLIISTSLSFGNSFFQEKDKQAHIGATAGIGFLVSAVAYGEGFSEIEAFWIGVASAMTVGVAKEIYDSRKGGTGFDMRDIGADAIGSVIGSSTVFVLYRW